MSIHDGQIHFAILEHSRQMVICHSPDECRGEVCSIHNRTYHHMRAFPQHWRQDRGIMERICPHGIGHPDPDCRSPHWDEARIHGCDGCCVSHEETTAT